MSVLSNRTDRPWAHLDGLHVGLEEEAVGDGGQAMVVNVLSPGLVFLHLGGGDTVTLDNLDNKIIYKIK